MTWKLYDNGAKIAESGAWNPVMFSDKTGTSFPAQVPVGWIWEEGPFLIVWEDDPAPVIDPKNAIRSQIAELEEQQTPRRIREALLTQSGAAWLADVDAQIADLRAQL